MEGEEDSWLFWSLESLSWWVHEGGLEVGDFLIERLKKVGVRNGGKKSERVEKKDRFLMRFFFSKS